MILIDNSLQDSSELVFISATILGNRFYNIRFLLFPRNIGEASSLALLPNIEEPSAASTGS